jgi:hypothetical protein
MGKRLFFLIFFFWGVLLTVLLWSIYDPLRDLVGAEVLAGVVLYLLIGVPAVLYLVSFIIIS